MALLISGAIVAYFQTRAPEADPYASIVQIPPVTPLAHPSVHQPALPLPSVAQTTPAGKPAFGEKTTPPELEANQPPTATTPDLKLQSGAKAGSQSSKPGSKASSGTSPLGPPFRAGQPGQPPSWFAPAGLEPSFASSLTGYHPPSWFAPAGLQPSFVSDLAGNQPPSWFAPPTPQSSFASAVGGTEGVAGLVDAGNDSLIVSRFDEPEFVYSRLPSDAPDANFPLLLESERGADINIVQGTELSGHPPAAGPEINNQLTPTEQDMINHARSGFFTTPPQPKPPLPPAPPVIPSPPESPSGL